jgi:hypothetical protein
VKDWPTAFGDLASAPLAVPFVEEEVGVAQVFVAGIVVAVATVGMASNTDLW